MRSKSLNPHSYSRSLICRDSADWLMRRRNAALETVPRSVTATNVRRRLRSIPRLISKLHKGQTNYALDGLARPGIFFARASVKKASRSGRDGPDELLQ